MTSRPGLFTLTAPRARSPWYRIGTPDALSNHHQPLILPPLAWFSHWYRSRTAVVFLAVARLGDILGTLLTAQAMPAKMYFVYL